jgi:hypothetical protein
MMDITSFSGRSILEICLSVSVKMKVKDIWFFIVDYDCGSFAIDLIYQRKSRVRIDPALIFHTV